AEGQVGHQGDIGIQLRIEPDDPLECRLRDLVGGEFAPRDPLRHVTQGEGADLIGMHARPLPRPGALRMVRRPAAPPPQACRTPPGAPATSARAPPCAPRSGESPRRVRSLPWLLPHPPPLATVAADA